ncbi:MAG TPA: hypothetical protein VD765_04140 [Solirubrobacterales bacterium]|nr:hypothetical protein [Solirubrobacterales bacterium]
MDGRFSHEQEPGTRMDPDEHERHHAALTAASALESEAEAAHVSARRTRDHAIARAAEAGMSRRELAALTNLSDDRVQQILDDLVGSGEARQAETHSA